MGTVEKLNTMVAPTVALTSAALAFYPDENVSRVANLVCAAWVTSKIMTTANETMKKVGTCIALAAVGNYISPLIVGGAYAFSTVKEKFIGKQEEPVVEKQPDVQQKPAGDFLSRMREQLKEDAQRAEDYFVNLHAPAERDHVRKLYKEKAAEIDQREATRKADREMATVRSFCNRDYANRARLAALNAADEALAADAGDESPVVRRRSVGPKRTADREIVLEGEKQQLAEQTTKSLRSREIQSPSYASAPRAVAKTKRTVDSDLYELGLRQGLDRQEGRVLRNRVVRL